MGTFPFLIQVTFDTFNDHYYIYKILEPLRILYKSESNISLTMTPENNQTLFEQHQSKLIPLTEEEMATAMDENKVKKAYQRAKPMTENLQNR